jgi:hypothetical protein
LAEAPPWGVAAWLVWGLVLAAAYYASGMLGLA